ncbi:MAG: hypothetical protein ABIH23_30590 [bacterium]
MDIRSKILELTDLPRQETGDHWVDYRRVDDQESERIKAATGLEVTGFIHMIDKSAVNHILNKHGPGNETRGGSIPVTREDIARIPEITATADSIVYEGKSKRLRLEVIRYRKRENGITFVVVEVRNGRRKLAVITMYKVATGGTDAVVAEQEAPASTSETVPSPPPTI